MNNLFEVHPMPLVRKDDGRALFRCRFEYPNQYSQTVFIQAFGIEEIIDSAVCDWMAIASIFPAMQYSDSLHIHGSVNTSLLANLSEFNAIWNVWRPEKYSKLKITADHVIESLSVLKTKGCIFAFSGGIDACATLARHAGSSMGWRRKTPSVALLVHGFDIDLENESGYEVAFKSASIITQGLGVPLAQAKTNLKELPVNWEDSFVAMLSSVLTAVGSGRQGGVIASGETYADPVFPWGSNPISNPLLGSASFPLHTDGAELTRLEKVALVAYSATALENVRVCWEGSQQGVNCGECEKCVRTQLELLAIGVNNLSAFKKPLTIGSISRIKIRNQLQASYLSETLEYVRRHNIDAWWVKELQELNESIRKLPIMQRVHSKLRSAWRRAINR